MDRGFKDLFWGELIYVLDPLLKFIYEMPFKRHADNKNNIYWNFVVIYALTYVWKYREL